MLTRIIIASVMIIALNLIQVTGIAQLLLYLATYLIIGYDILKKAGKGIINRQVLMKTFNGGGNSGSFCASNLLRKWGLQ